MKGKLVINYEYASFNERGSKNAKGVIKNSTRIRK